MYMNINRALNNNQQQTFQYDKYARLIKDSECAEHSNTMFCYKRTIMLT